MKRNVIILLLTLASLNLFARTQGDKVDPLIEARFKKDFTSIQNVSWQVIDDVSIATYTEKGEEKQVYYFKSGEILGFGKAINIDLLPQGVTDPIRKRFTTGVIEKAYEFRANDAPTRYYVQVGTRRALFFVSASEFGDLRVDKRESVKQISY